MRIFKYLCILFCIAAFSYTGVLVQARTDDDKPAQKPKGSYNVLVDTGEFRLYVIDRNTGEVVKVYPIAGGKKATPSPYGAWKIIYKEANWGAGFGTRWMQLGVPWGTYGIHGTNKPLTINSPDSKGCIRMFNKDVNELFDMVDKNTLVVIYPGAYNLDNGVFRILKPGDRGADVLEVQRRLTIKGYYSGPLDGVYGEALKKQLIKFRYDNKLTLSHFADAEFYKAIGMGPFE